MAFLLTSASVFSQVGPGRKPVKIKPTGASLKAGNFIDVNVAPYPATGYFPEQLVKDILINGEVPVPRPILPMLQYLLTIPYLITIDFGVF